MNRLNFWQKFKRQKHGVYALIGFIFLLVLSLITPFLANDKPLWVYHQQRYYVPIFVDYPETTFGGDFETPTNYKDPEVIKLINEHGYMVMPIIPYSATTIDYQTADAYPSKPNRNNLLGTDDVGRDVLAFTLHALSLTLIFSTLLTIAGALIGMIVGSIMGYFGGWVDLLGQRLVEVWLGLPHLFILIILSSMFKPSIVVVFAIMLMFAWLPLVATTRLVFFSHKSVPYVLAAKNFGTPTNKIILHHILPFCLMINLAQLPFMMAVNITAISAMDFLGFGLPYGSASMGELLRQAKNNLDAPHLVMTALVLHALVLSLLLFIGEAIREALRHE